MSRLDWNSWFTGIVDGDGCFTYRRFHNPKRLHVQPYFFISLRADDITILEKCQVYFGGLIEQLPKRVRETHISRPMVRWSVNRKNLLQKLVAHFDDYTPQTKKLNQYKIWRRMVMIYISTAGSNKQLIALSDLLSEQSKFNSTQIDLVPIENPQLSLIEFSETQRR